MYAFSRISTSIVCCGSCTSTFISGYASNTAPPICAHISGDSMGKRLSLLRAFILKLPLVIPCCAITSITAVQSASISFSASVATESAWIPNTLRRRSIAASISSSLILCTYILLCALFTLPPKGRTAALMCSASFFSKYGRLSPFKCTSPTFTNIQLLIFF